MKIEEITKQANDDGEEKQRLSPSEAGDVEGTAKEDERRKVQCDSRETRKMWYSGNQIKKVFQEE